MNTCNNNNEVSSLNYGQLFFMTIGFLPIMLTLPCWLVARYIFEPMMSDYESRFQELVELLHIPIPYEERYPIKDASGNSITRTNNIVIDLTPDGNVAMRFNSNTEAFEYWSDKNISYKYLETVSRKYANSFGCGGLYIDRLGLLKDKVNKIKNEIKKNLNKKNDDNEKKDEKKVDDVFANLKNYKTSSTQDLKTKLTKNDVVCDEANKYIRKGKFADHSEWLECKQVVKEEHSTTSSRGGVMSWLEWKNHSKKD